jgi:Glycine rich protein
MFRPAHKTIIGLVLAATLGLAVSSAQALSGGCVAGATTTTCTFNYTGATEAWVVPVGVTSATFDVYGAAGGSFAPSGAFVGGSGGKGARVQATLALTPGETLKLRVGGVGQDGSLFSDFGTIAGGFNGGGTNTFTCSGCAFDLGGGGGGSSDVRTSADGLADRLLAAGGGGGAGVGGAFTFDPGTGGDSATNAKTVTGMLDTSGGPLTATCSGGGAGTLLGPGAAGGGGIGCVPGSAGDPGGLAGGGGSANGMGAGGGGYFGGGAGAAGGTIADSGGGGGSDFPDPANPPLGVSNVTIADGVRSGNGLIQVTFTAPAQQVSGLQGTVAGFGLPAGLTTALNSKLNAVVAALGADDSAAACGALQAFVNQVEAQTERKLTAAQAETLIAEAQSIQTALGC